MSKSETRLINYSDESFKDKFNNLIFDERKLNKRINVAVSNIIEKIRKNGDDSLNYYVKKFDKIKSSKISELFISKKYL